MTTLQATEIAMPALRTWSQAEDNKLRSIASAWTLAAARPDYDDLLVAFAGRSREGIRARLRTLGIDVPKRQGAADLAIREAIAAGLHLNEIVRRLGVVHRTVHKVAKRYGLTIAAFVETERPVKATLVRPNRQPRSVAAKVVSPVTKPVAPLTRAPLAVGPPAQPRTPPEPIQLPVPVMPFVPKKRASTFNTWRKREVGRVVCDKELTALIAAHISAKGVTRVDEEPHEAALTKLRRRGYVVIREGDAVVVDHRHRLVGPAEILAFADARGLA